LRIAAQVSGDPTLVRAYKENLDPHSITAEGLARMNGWNSSEWTYENILAWKKDKKHVNHTKADELRKLSKTVTFGSLNGQGPKTMMETAKTGSDPIEMTLGQAKEGIDAWKATYAVLYSFQKQVNRRANSYNHTFPWVEGVFGESRGLTNRRLFLEKLPSFNDASVLTVKYNDCLAMVWMSAEADVAKRAMAATLDKIYEHPEWGMILMSMCHDELDLEVKEEYAKEAAAAVLEIMNKSLQDILPDIPAFDPTVTPESIICDSWAEK
jgi:DNA polymerase I-like protein with 3'-5' exonuclease and polymerase domains